MGGARQGAGRPRGSRNKLHTRRDAIKAAAAAGHSIPDFDVFETLKTVAKQFLAQAAAEQRKDNPDIKFFNERLINAARVLKDILPYQRPRLMAVVQPKEEDEAGVMKFRVTEEQNKIVEAFLADEDECR